MTSPQELPPQMHDFEKQYCFSVIDLYVQSKETCRDPEWAKRVAPQLVDIVEADSGLAREVIRAGLNVMWTKIGELGTAGYLTQLVKHTNETLD